MEAARHWAMATSKVTPSGEDEFDSDIAAMGLPDDDGQDGGGDENDGSDDDRFAVWPENDRALQAFLICRRQWRVGPMGGFLGLYYPGVESLLRMNGIPIDAELITDLGVIEGAALEVFNKEKK